jgi:cytochrome c5
MKAHHLLLVSIISAAACEAQAQGNVSGEAVVRAQCAKCHGSGLNGAPKIGDRAAWIARAKNGIDPLVLAAMRGHGNMPARGGMASLTDAEFRSAVLYMFNAQEPLKK